MLDRIPFYCSNLISILLILIPFVASFSSAAVNIFIGFIILLFIIKKLISRNLILPSTSINLPFLILIFVSLCSFVNTVSLRASLQGIVKLIKYGFLFIVIVEELRDIRHLKKIIIAIIIGLYLACLDGIYQLYFGSDFFRHRPYDFVIGLPRLNATFPHTNIFAVYLGLLSPVSISLGLYYLKGRKRILFILVTLLFLYCLVFTFSRGAILGLLAALFFMALCKQDKVILLVLVAILIITPFILPQNIRNWINTTDSIWEVLLNKERINIYKSSLNMIKAHPFIGVGVNTFSLNYQKYKILETSGFTGDAKYYAHNIFLHMAGEIGLIGLTIFLWILFRFFKSCVVFFRTPESDFLKISALGVVAGIIGFLVNGLTETNLYYSKVATLFWYQVGLFLGIYKLDKIKQEK